MPKGLNEITQEECPELRATPYPGKFSRKNKGGSKLSKDEFVEEQVRRWVDFFSENPKYDDTSIAHKVMYLVRHLSPLKVKSKLARSLLVKVESDKECRLYFLVKAILLTVKNTILSVVFVY